MILNFGILSPPKPMAGLPAVALAKAGLNYYLHGLWWEADPKGSAGGRLMNDPRWYYGSGRREGIPRFTCRNDSGITLGLATTGKLLLPRRSGAAVFSLAAFGGKRRSTVGVDHAVDDVVHASTSRSRRRVFLLHIGSAKIFTTLTPRYIEKTMSYILN